MRRLSLILVTLVRDFRSSSPCGAAVKGELRKKVNDMEEKTFRPVSSVEQLQAKVRTMAKERDSLAAKCEELILEVQCISCSDEKARSLCPCVVKTKESSKTKASKMRTRRWILVTEAVAEQAPTGSAEHTARIAQLYVDLHELEGKLDFFERLNNVADLRYFMVSDKNVTR